jgi:tRNA-2-methylthio-N6-dimethylallyladenosine synthase
LPKTLPKTLHIKTFGCQMNQYDSERMAEALAAQGYALTADAAEADLVILNTCHIREKAAEKVYSELGRVRLNKERRRREGRDTLIAVAGCVAQAAHRNDPNSISRTPRRFILIAPLLCHRLLRMNQSRAARLQEVLSADPSQESARSSRIDLPEMM